MILRALWRIVQRMGVPNGSRKMKRRIIPRTLRKARAGLAYGSSNSQCDADHGYPVAPADAGRRPASGSEVLKHGSYYTVTEYSEIHHFTLRIAALEGHGSVKVAPLTLRNTHIVDHHLSAPL